MNIFKLIGELVVLYVLYNVVFNFIIPIYNASKQMKGTFNNMREQQNSEQQHTQKTNQEKPNNSKSAIEGDYIDYEEIK